jgi:hypothetical protein
LHQRPSVATPDRESGPARRGYLLLAAVVVAALGIFNLERIVDAVRPKLAVLALVSDAPDVRVGTDVWVEGVRMGRVKQVTLAKEGDSTLVGLTLRLDRQARELVTRSSDVRVSRRRFIAEPVVRVFAGSPEDPPLEPGDTLRGQPRPGPAELMARVEALAPAVDSVLGAAVDIQARIHARAPAFQNLAAQMDAAGAAARTLTAQSEAGSLGRMLDRETGMPAQVGALRQRLAALGDATDQLVARYSADGPLGSDVRGLGNRLRSLEEALTDLETRIEDGGGFLGRVEADSALEVAVRGVRLQIDSLMAEAHSIALRMFLP